ncbi:MAG: DUF3343 domain-containing protein [Atopococcus tabaci]|uniref:DUF3343 domain-containing protein n=1 Tax=Atopococcus tabaci TaxID=269774 RepID=A0AA43UDE8_9LACT|nr:DUF3343 domain-containing protein [Atopococcus tabaci]
MNRLLEFQTREDLMLVENQLSKKNVACKLAASPALIKRGCGLSLKFNAEDVAEVMSIMADLTIRPSFEIYENIRDAAGRSIIRKLASSIKQ